MKKYLLIFTSCIFILASCKQGRKSTEYAEIVSYERTETPQIFDVLKSSNLYSNPSESSSKLINEKATEALDSTIYMSIDNSCRVEIVEKEEGWYKVHVVSPNWLSSTHIGWVKSDVLANPNECVPELVENTDYKLIKENKMGRVRNLYFAYLKPFDEVSILKIAKALKEKYSEGGQMNIYIYDSTDNPELMDKYPLSNEEYLKVADHYIYMYDFNNSGWYYPFQDIKYKELGGKNWKKTPIE